jgi:SAM-dependent methyltransferase
MKMSQVPLMGTAMRLSTQLEALAALAAHLRVTGEGLDADPRVRALLSAIADELTCESPAAGPAEAAAVVGMTRTLLAQSAELIADPARAPGWSHSDPQILQGTGRMSTAIVSAISAARGSLPGLGERLAAEDGVLLDVGTGTAWLAIALAEAFPTLRVVGTDIYETALGLARANVAAAGHAGRIELRLQDVTQLGEEAVYDVVWLPLPFLPREIVPSAMTAALRALRPGGWVLPGAYAGAPGRLSELLVDLRTVRSGGHPWSAGELTAELTGHGFEHACEVERTWAAPVRLFGGRRRL